MRSGLLKITGDAKVALATYHKGGGAVQYFLGDPERSDHEVVDAVMFKLRKSFPKQKMTYDIEKARTQPVTLKQFVGRGYDFKTKQLVSLWKVSEDGRSASLGGTGMLGLEHDYVTDAYAQAFSEPPYGLFGDLAGLRRGSELFVTINNELLGGLHNGLPINQWSTDWSSYFDAGHEWWGSFLWTIRPPDRDWVVVITASTTD